MTINNDIRQLGPLEIVELFQFDATAAKIQAPKGTPIFYWHSGLNPLGTYPVIWQGKLYEPYPISTDGWQATTSGKLPRPTVRVSNIGGQIGAFIRSIKDSLGAKVTRIRTLGKYLDAANFPNGNPYANPNAYFPSEIFYVNRKVSENPLVIELELATAFDVEGVMLPRRQVMATICPWIYRGPDCTYAGPPVQDIDGVATTDKTRDMCNKGLAACRARFGEKGVLKFGGFPGSLLGSNV
jgi:lambda family phage minor tail protein L